MKILNPIIFNGIIEKGGSTRPWKVTLDEDGTERAYVVKLFTPQTIEQQHATGKEAFGNFLGRELGLFVPDSALVNFTKPFVELVLDTGHREQLLNYDSGLKFASKLQDGMSIYTSSLHRKFLKEWDFANIYAFDCLCYNLDRGKRPDKSNILVEDNNFLLIDHEQTFPFIDNLDGLYRKILQEFEQGYLDYQYQSHIFYTTLKDMRIPDKRNLFDEFQLFLHNLNIQKVRDFIFELGKLDIVVGNSQRLIDYLCRVKRESKKFCDILLKSIA